MRRRHRIRSVAAVAAAVLAAFAVSVTFVILARGRSQGDPALALAATALLLVSALLIAARWSRARRR